MRGKGQRKRVREKGLKRGNQGQEAVETGVGRGSIDLTYTPHLSRPNITKITLYGVPRAYTS